ncbi:MAG: HlyD family type I secretion periplasmic adaptor subunit [Sulfurimonas sp.]|uniref:HlyD family type I secretion periplasmic adaptor subunit n=1 Tax=Sulfurimonas sp. TaxID=2022749 RepID=UPI0025DCEFDA|nr:HlyD family type I secretion periplasmic adaptor subunit [Sulfurimonas sp.]MCK9490492.1 HlyD family type I secretion periplasmic adaptor subunit [Sulfurimonas sp.]
MSYRYLQERSWNYRFFVLPIIVFITVFLIWAYFAEIDESVKGVGKVIPSGQTRLLQHLEGGIITHILVAEGDVVKKGEVLFRIKNQYFISEQRENIIKLTAYQAKLKRISSLLQDEKELTFDKNIYESIPLIIENEIAIFYSQKRGNDSELSILQEQLNQKKARLKEFDIRLENLSIEYNLSQQNMKIQEELSKKGAISKEKYLQNLSVKQKLYTQLQEIRYTIPVLKTEIKEFFNKIDSKKLDIRSKLLQENSEVQIEIKKLEELMQTDVDRDARIAVSSPTKGIVNKINYNTIGGIVKSGETIAEISPLEDELMIEAKINTADRAYIYPGQDVFIEITAYESSKYGLVKGKLIGISPDSSTDDKGGSFYTIKVRANNYRFDDDSPILIGMTANVNILTGKRTILHYLLKPMKDIKYRALTEH